MRLHDLYYFVFILVTIMTTQSMKYYQSLVFVGEKL